MIASTLHTTIGHLNFCDAGVFFRKHTKEAADALGLVGWCQNTAKGTVIGEAQGSDANIANLYVTPHAP